MEREVTWKPNPGPQTWLLSCPVLDVFFGGARGGGKTDALLGDWAAHSARYGKDAHGIIFRRSMPELEDVIRRSREIYQPIGAEFREQSKTWVMPGSAELRMRYLEADADAARYQGHAYTWMGFDEMGNWASPLPLDQLRACLRSNASVPCALRGTGNPGGPGHEWVKKRYIDPSPPLTPFTVGGITRVFIPSKLSDNPRLTNAEQYTANIRNSGPDWLVKAWLEGDWSGPPAGGIISPEWLRTYDALPRLGPISIAADLAYRVGQKNDESSIGAFGLTAESELVWLPDLVIGHLDTLQSVNAIMDLAQRHNVGEFYAARDMITGSIGPFLYKAMEERNCWFTLIEVANHQDQLLRSRSFIARTQQGKILWPSGDLYRTKIQPQLVSYDGLGKQRDDIVAMAAHGCMGLDMHDNYRAPKEAKKDHANHKRWKEIANRTRPVQDDAQYKLFGRSRT
jgi:hypothetical protein